MKQFILKKVSLFFLRLVKIVGAFFLMVFLFVKHALGFVVEIMRILLYKISDDFSGNPPTEQDDDKRTFSEVWQSIQGKSPKEMSIAVIANGKHLAHHTKKRVLKAIEMILPAIIAAFIVFILFIGLVIIMGWLEILFEMHPGWLWLMIVLVWALIYALLVMILRKKIEK